MSDKLYKVMNKVFGLKENEVENASMQTVREWDSLKHIALMMAIEEEFGIPKITPDEIVKMTSIAQIKTVLKEKVKDL